MAKGSLVRLCEVEDPIAGLDIYMTMDKRDSIVVVLFTKLGSDLECSQRSLKVLRLGCRVGLFQRAYKGDNRRIVSYRDRV